LNETDVMNASNGRLLVRGHTHQSFLPPKDDSRGEGFVIDEKTTAKKSDVQKKAERPPFPTAAGPDLPAHTTLVDERRCWMFSGPGRNYHTDAEQAKKLGFPNIVVQGMMSTCFVSRMMQEQFGLGWLAGGEMSVKLTNVLWVDETVTTRGKIREEVPEGTQTRVHCDVWCEKESEQSDQDEPTKILVGTASALV